MRKTLSLILIVLALLLFTACTNDIKAPDDSWENIFLQYWNAMNTEYVHFDDSKLDWDKVYDDYLPKFQALDYTEPLDSLEAFRYFKEISRNVDDYHYNLKVRDGFGSSLNISPALENKWAAATDGDISSFPDVTWVDSTLGITYLKSVDGKTIITSVNKNTYVEDYLGKVEGILEVSNLQASGSFHSSAVFEAEAGFDFSVISEPDANSKVADIAAYSVVSGLGLGSFSYYYGVTSDDIFYFYISEFAATVLEDFLEALYTEPDALTEAQEQKLTDNGLYQLYCLIWCVDDGSGSSGPDYSYDLTKYPLEYDVDGTPKTEVNLIAKLKEVYNLYKILNSIGTTDKCKMVNASGVEEEFTVKGIIMDVRSNGGGAVYFLEKLMGCFFKDSTVIGKSRYKDGYSRLEFSPWMEFKLEYSNGTKDYDKPFAIITNGYSVSCSEISSSIVKNLMANGAVIGGNTYGGTCALTDRNVYHSGPFTSNSLTIYTTTYETELKTKDGKFEDMEGKGIAPDVSVDVDTTYATDKRFEAAVKWVNENATV